MSLHESRRRHRWLIFGAPFLIAWGLAATARAGGPETTGADESQATPLWLFVGTYTQGKTPSEGIYLLELDPATGHVTNKGAVGKLSNPSFLAIHPSRKFLYAVNELSEFKGKGGGGVSALAIDQATGKLTPLNAQSSVGSGPCHLTVDATGKNVLVANYGSGSVACLPIGDDGTLKPASSFIQHGGKGTDPGRQQGPHAHSINLDKANKVAFAADLGLDKVFLYAFDADKGKLGNASVAEVAPKTGPRHLAIQPDGQTVYVIGEMANTITVFRYTPDQGSMTKIQTIGTLPGDFRGRSYTAEVQVHPSGKFVYGSNRGHDSIAIFEADPSSGKLTAVGHEPTGGKNPRNFAIDPSGKFLLTENQDSDSIFVFRIDPNSGKLTQVGEPVRVPMPVCIRMMPRPAGAN